MTGIGRCVKGILVIGAAGAVALPNSASSDTRTGRPSATTAATADQWRATDRSMLDLVEDGYELVTVVATSPQVRTYLVNLARSQSVRRMPR
jgi:hypothetical protein